jgi:hypothetical protein
MSQRPNVADLSSDPPSRIGDGQWQSKKHALNVGNQPLVNLADEPYSLKSVYKQWERKEDGQRVSDIIESKRILTLECSKEILRLTHLVRELQQEQQSIRKAYELKYPSCYPSRPPSSRPPKPPIDKQPEPPQQKVITRGIRKVQRSMQFDGQDVAALFGEQNMQIGTDVTADAQGKEETDVYQLEIVISDKRENANKTEYHVQKKIRFSRWQSLQNLKKENLHDFVKKFDQNLKEESLSGKNNNFLQEKNLKVKKKEMENNSSTESGSEIVLVTGKNEFLEAGNKLSNEQNDAKSGGIDKIVSPHFNDVSQDLRAEDSGEEEVGNPYWFLQHSEEKYDFSDLSSSGVQTIVRSSIGSNSLSEGSQGSQSPLSKKSFGYKPTLTERAPSNNLRIPSIQAIE